MSDHIPDATKMVSDTPRTEEFDGEYSEWSPAKPKNWPAFARQLERELNESNDRIRLLIAERDTARLQADRHYKLREEFRELLGTDDVEHGVAVVRGLKQRINRLEDAGDAMMPSCFDRLAKLKWKQAKEAKL